MRSREKIKDYAIEQHTTCMDDAVLEVLLDIRDILQSPANEEKTDEVKEQHAEIGKSVDKDDIGEFVKSRQTAPREETQ